MSNKNRKNNNRNNNRSGKAERYENGRDRTAVAVKKWCAATGTPHPNLKAAAAAAYELHYCFSEAAAAAVAIHNAMKNVWMANWDNGFIPLSIAAGEVLVSMADDGLTNTDKDVVKRHILEVMTQQTAQPPAGWCGEKDPRLLDLSLLVVDMLSYDVATNTSSYASGW